MYPQIWLVIFVILVIAEVLTMGLTTIWFALGALASFAVSLFSSQLWLQIVVFLVVSLIVLIFYRPLAVKYVNSRSEKTNIDELIGKEGRVTEKIDNFGQTGRILLNGMDWAARAKVDGIVIEADTIVRVKEVKGVKLIVEPALDIYTKEEQL